MSDPFEAALPEPHLWFGLLCESAQIDNRGRASFFSIFNQIPYLTPPANTGIPPNAFLRGFLAIGFSGGLGQFSVAVEIRDADDHTLWQRPTGEWEFEIGPTGNNSAALIEEVQHWFGQSGRYHFWVRLAPTDRQYQIPFDVGERIGGSILRRPGQPDLQL